MVSPGYQAMGRHKHRRDQTGSSRGGTDDMTDYLPDINSFYAPRRHRVHRRSQPVTQEEYQRAGGNPGMWGNAGVQPPAAAYNQFASPGGPLYGHENERAIPVVQVPMPAQVSHSQRGIEEVRSNPEQSEVSSSSQGGASGHRRASVRRHHSKSSTSHGGRSGPR